MKLKNNLERPKINKASQIKPTKFFFSCTLSFQLNRQLRSLLIKKTSNFGLLLNSFRVYIYKKKFFYSDCCPEWISSLINYQVHTCQKKNSKDIHVRRMRGTCPYNISDYQLSQPRIVQF